MAKHTQKNDALGMFAKTKPVNIKKSVSAEKVEEKVEKKPAAKKEEKVAAPIMPEPVIEPEVVKSVADVEPALTINTSKISLEMKPVKKERSHNTRSFYLKDETYNKLVAMAKKNNAGISEYLEFILGQIL
ncbi:MAG: hypothetical protein J6N21_00695 [Butyrivibrio sp.]|nr:hypothetical protein [Butyrivibrio sp.]